jgi:hypothetical protein
MISLRNEGESEARSKGPDDPMTSSSLTYSGFSSSKDGTVKEEERVPS